MVKNPKNLNILTELLLPGLQLLLDNAQNLNRKKICLGYTFSSTVVEIWQTVKSAIQNPHQNLSIKMVVMTTVFK